MDLYKGNYTWFLDNIEMLSLLYLVLGIINGAFLYKIARGLLFPRLSLADVSYLKSWGPLADITIVAFCSVYMVVFTALFNISFVCGKMPINNIENAPSWNGVAHYWPNPSEVSLRLMSAFNSIHSIGDFYSFTYVLIPLGFSALCIADIKRLPIWFKPVAFISAVYIVIKSISFIVRSNNEPIYWIGEYKFSAFAKIDAYAIWIVFAILKFAFLYMLVRAFKPMYRGKKR